MATYDGGAARFTILHAIAGRGIGCLQVSWDTAGAEYVDIDGAVYPRRGDAWVQVSPGARVRLTACAPAGQSDEVRFAYVVRGNPAVFPHADAAGALAAVRFDGLRARTEPALGTRLRELRMPLAGRQRMRTVGRQAPRRPWLPAGPVGSAARGQLDRRGGR
jgi:hypothetical protein